MVGAVPSTQREEPLHWVASSKKAYQAFADQVKDDMGYASLC